MREVTCGDESFELDEREILVHCPECNAVNQVEADGGAIEECFACAIGFCVENARIAVCC